MQNNYFNTNQYPNMYPAQNPNAVSINIISPQAYGSNAGVTCPMQNGSGFYSLYGQNAMPNYGYPQNYNNLGMHQSLIPPNYVANAYQNNINNYPQGMYQNGAYPNGANQQGLNQNGLNQQPNGMNDVNQMNGNNQDGLNNQSNLASSTNLINKTDVPNEQTVNNAQKTDKTKKVTPLTDDYIKSLENYLNNENPKIRLIGAKEVMERFKEDENRKDNPSLMALLNKTLRDTSPAVRFLGLTTLQLGYAVGNNETVTILQEIQSQNKDKIGEDSLLASEILLLMAGGEKVDAPMTQNEIEKAQAKTAKKEGK
ncbi:MAG: hypothetical protein IJW73_06920 [Candidatus Gastranaerophilales bacterium]|nr:hypothetical protein [Candidatus Gastranaerophilales bacterium]